MTRPLPGQSVPMMSHLGMVQTLLNMRLKEGRNVAELALYTTGDLRRLYQAANDDPFKLRDDIVSRV